MEKQDNMKGWEFNSMMGLGGHAATQPIQIDQH